MNSKKFEAQFHEKMDEIESRAREVGINMTIICQEARASRATPDRWKRQIPKTIQIVTAMEDVVERYESEFANTIPGERE